MAKITLSIPQEIKALMNEFPEVNWSEVFRNVIAQKVRKLEKFEKLEGEL